jgi:hypothetical protein
VTSPPFQDPARLGLVSLGGYHIAGQAEAERMITPWFPWLEMVCICAGVSGFAILGAMWIGPPGIPL